MALTGEAALQLKMLPIEQPISFVNGIVSDASVKNTAPPQQISVVAVRFIKRYHYSNDGTGRFPGRNSSQCTKNRAWANPQSLCKHWKKVLVSVFLIMQIIVL